MGGGELANVIRTSQTNGLIKNDGTIDTNTYLTSHQDISGKANSSDLATIATTGSYNDLTDMPLVDEGDIIYLTFTGTTFQKEHNQATTLMCTGGGDIVVEWGDGSFTTYQSPSYISHTYETNGTYEIKIKGNITYLGQYVFSGINISKVKLSSKVTTIENSFYDNENLSEVIVSPSVTRMSRFRECPNLRKIIFEGNTPPNMEGLNQDYEPSSCVIYVPSSSYNLYMQKANNPGNSKYPSSSNYKYVAISDSVIDSVIDNDYSAISSNAVYEGINTAINSIDWFESNDDVLEELLDYGDSYQKIIVTQKYLKNDTDGRYINVIAQLSHTDDTPTHKSGIPIVFKNGNTTLATINTDENGRSTYKYNVEQLGEMTLTVSTGNEITLDILLEDVIFKGFTGTEKWYNNLNHDTEVTYNYDSENALHSNSLKNAFFEKTFILDGDWEFSFKCKGTTRYNAGARWGIKSTSNGVFNSNSCAICIENYSNYIIFPEAGRDNKYSINGISSYTSFKFKAVGTTLQIYRDDSLIRTFNNVGWLSDELTFIIHQWVNYIDFYWKDLKLKILHE